MAKQKQHRQPRKASDEQARAMAQACSGMETDDAATAGLGAGCEDGDVVYAELPDEERNLLQKVDFSVLERELMEVRILDDESRGLLSRGQLVEYARGLEETLQFYVRQHADVSAELACAMELILNQRVERFGRSSQRSSTLFSGGKEGGGDKEPGKPSAEAGNPGRDADGLKAGDMPQAGAGEKAPDTGQAGEGGKNTGAGDPPAKGKPRRSAGCAAKVIENAEVVHIPCTIPEEKLKEMFGGGGWKEMPSAERTATEYSVIPAKLIVKIYHLHAYAAADRTDPGTRGVVRAKLPIGRPRPKSPISSGLFASILHDRNSLRIPVDRICRELCSGGLAMTPQRVYDNLGYYAERFHFLTERLWTILLSSRYIQIDETPVLFYDKAKGKVVRGYFWVFTTSEMLIGGRPLTLCHFALGRGADVLRQCLKGFEGTVGSDGHIAYHVFARESCGKVVNAGCLDHFRKRLVLALRAIPGLMQMPDDEKMGIPAYVIMLRLNEVFRLDRKTKGLATKEERDAYRNGPVRDAFESLVETARAADTGKYPAGSYTCSAIRYLENQEEYLREFLDDSNIASNNSKCERKFAFFGILRNQIKMFGSEKGAMIAADLESIEQTAREYIQNTRIYYRFLIDKLCTFVNEQSHKADLPNMKEMDCFLPWSDEYKLYEADVLEKERILLTVAEHF